MYFCDVKPDAAVLRDEVMASAGSSVSKIVSAHRRDLEATWHLDTGTCDVALETTCKQFDGVWYDRHHGCRCYDR